MLPLTSQTLINDDEICCVCAKLYHIYFTCNFHIWIIILTNHSFVFRYLTLFAFKSFRTQARNTCIADLSAKQREWYERICIKFLFDVQARTKQCAEMYLRAPNLRWAGNGVALFVRTPEMFSWIMKPIIAAPIIIMKYESRTITFGVIAPTTWAWSTYLHTPPFSQKYSSPSWHSGPRPQSSPLNPGKHEQ